MFEDFLAVVYKELCYLIGTARREVWEEGGATGSGKSNRGHEVLGGTFCNLIIHLISSIQSLD